MELSRKAGQQIMLGTGLLLIVSMFIFPRQFGTELAKASFINALYELVFYGLVLYLFNRRSSLIQLAQAAGLCLIYRLGVGAVFGLLVSTSYSMNLSVSLHLGMSKYLPAILFQIALTPFLLLSTLRSALGVSETRTLSREMPGHTLELGGVTSVAISRKKGVVMGLVEPAHQTMEREPISRQRHAALTLTSDLNGFERAVRYIGEHGSVYMAAVVDTEGLLLARFCRGNFEPENLAPMTGLLNSCNAEVLGREGFGFSGLERIDLALNNERIVITTGRTCSLLVIAERHSDDFLNIRINQGMDIIRKYAEDKYGESETVDAEKIHVPGTQ